MNFLKNYFGKHWDYCRFLQGWVWEEPSLVPAKCSLLQVFPVLVVVFSPTVVNRDGTIKFSPNAERRCCLHVLQVQFTCQQLKNCSYGNYQQCICVCRIPEVHSICLRLQLVRRLRKNPPVLKICFITDEWISDHFSSQDSFPLFWTTHMCCKHKVKVFQIFFPKIISKSIK